MGKEITISDDGVLIVSNDVVSLKTFEPLKYGKENIRKIDLNNLTKVDAFILIEQLPNLVEIDLGNLIECENLTITSNPKLNKIDFRNLKTIKGNLDVRGNKSLKEIDLSNIKTVNRYLALPAKYTKTKIGNLKVLNAVYIGNKANEKLTNILRGD